jgi:hypothetical protein
MVTLLRPVERAQTLDNTLIMNWCAKIPHDLIDTK